MKTNKELTPTMRIALQTIEHAASVSVSVQTGNALERRGLVRIHRTFDGPREIHWMRLYYLTK